MQASHGQNSQVPRVVSAASSLSSMNGHSEWTRDRPFARSALACPAFTRDSAVRSPKAEIGWARYQAIAWRLPPAQAAMRLTISIISFARRWVSARGVDLRDDVTVRSKARFHRRVCVEYRHPPSAAEVFDGLAEAAVGRKNTDALTVNLSVLGASRWPRGRLLWAAPAGATRRGARELFGFDHQRKFITR